MSPTFRLINIGARSGPRRDSCADAYHAFAGQPALMLTWDEVIHTPEKLTLAVGPDCYIRFDSPDQDDIARAALYQLGQAHAEEVGLKPLSDEDIESLRFGEIGSPSQLAFGIAAAITKISDMVDGANAQLSISADDVATMFDKAACNQHLGKAIIAVPQSIPFSGGFDALVEAMDSHRASRVFVKLRHGAAAAGIMALVRNGDQWIGTTTAVIGDDGRAYASRKLRRIHNRADIAHIIDTLAPLGLHVERWVPKMGHEGRTVDLRIVVMGGNQLFPVLRSSHHPITNLHIGGQRGPIEAFAEKLGPEVWDDIMSNARRAARTFPSAHCLGLDSAVLVDGRRHVALEVNAFGDHVRDFTDNGFNIHGALMHHIATVMPRNAEAFAA